MMAASVPIQKFLCTLSVNVEGASEPVDLWATLLRRP
jgi:hypothetical protein